MYNEAIKTKFISDYSKGDMHIAGLANSVFDIVEPFEGKWGADICTKGAEDIQPVVDHIVGLRSRSKIGKINVLRDYVKWCLSNQIPGACDGMLNVGAEGLDKIRRQMVANPLGLQSYLDALCEPEKLKTTDNIYRCYYWLAYSGMAEEDILKVKTSDVDFTTLTVRFNDLEYPMYRESLPAFKNCVTLTEFVYKHPLYSKLIYKDRVPGDLLIRGVKQQPVAKTLRVELSRRAKKAVEDNKTTTLRLSHFRVWLSGLFYQMYEREKAGFPVDFSEAARKFASGKEYNLSSTRNTPEAIIRRISTEYLNDYQRWKMAFKL